jgi:hypothetical protein
MVYHDAAKRALQDPLALYEKGDRTYQTGSTFNYPPPAIVPFMLAAPLGYGVSFAISSLLSLCASLAITFVSVLFVRDRTPPPCTRHTTAIALATWAVFVPVWQDAKHGQVNAIVALMCLLYVLWIHQRRPMLAAAAVTIGFWLKLYSILILLPVAVILLQQCAVTRARADLSMLVRALAYPIVCIALTVILLMPLLPWSLYVQYALVEFPSLSGYTGLNPFNQSLAGFMARAIAMGSNYSNNGFLYMPLFVKGASMAALVLTVCVTGAYAWRVRSMETVQVLFIFMAMIPVISTYGWEYTYIFVLPLLVHTVMQGSTHSASLSIVILLGTSMVLFAIPKPSEEMLVRLETMSLSPTILHIFFSRFLIATLLLIITSVMCTRRSNTDLKRKQGSLRHLSGH